MKKIFAIGVLVTFVAACSPQPVPVLSIEDGGNGFAVPENVFINDGTGLFY